MRILDLWANPELTQSWESVYFITIKKIRTFALSIYQVLQTPYPMNNTIVNIIDAEDPLPLYLFVKEMYHEGDRVLFVSRKADSHKVGFFIKLLKLNPDKVDSIVLSKREDEYTYELICRTLVENLSKEEHYLVNLAGGTRYMALAVQRSFARFNSDFYYTQTRENLIVSTIFDDSIYDDDDIVMPIRHRMKVRELLNVNGLVNDSSSPTHEPIRSEDYTKMFYNLFVDNRLSAHDHEAIALLRQHYRGKRKFFFINQIVNHGYSYHPKIEHLNELLTHLRFIPQTQNKLTKEEIDYITGGWFEEYTYHLVKHQVAPDDIAIGIHIAREGTPHNNELDVVYAKNNHLYVIECKTGVDSNRMFNEIVYKVCALREVLLGTTCKSYIFSLLRDEDNHLHQVARLMGVRFCDYNDIVKSEKLKLGI